VLEADGSSTSTTYAGNTSTIMDEAGNKRKSQTDALGRLTAVWEDPLHLNYETDYLYNILGDLLQATQKGGDSNSANWRVRTFTYNSLGQLLCAANPEISAPLSTVAKCPVIDTGSYIAGTTRYQYDNDGELISKTAPLPNQAGTATVVTSFSYDVLHRLMSKNYSSSADNGTAAATPPVTYTYDPSIPNGNGHLATEYTGTSASPLSQRNMTQYDTMGRLRGEQQCPIAPCATFYSFQYGYDLAGDLTSANNGLTAANINGSITAAQVIGLGYSYDAARHLRSVTSSGTGIPGPTTLFQAAAQNSSPAYGPVGLMNAQLGVTSSAPGVQLTRAYDNRLRLVSETDAGQTNEGPVLGTQSTGSISVTGGEQQFQPQSTTSSSTITISGTEGSYKLVICNPPGSERCTSQSYPDTGTVAITVNGFTSSAAYGLGSTDATVASALATGFAASGSPVTATASGSTITLTSKAAGTASNYPLSFTTTSTSVSDTKDFSATAPAPTMTGGTSPSSVYDTGTVAVTINNVKASASWGQGDTPATFATKLASAINIADGSFLTASVASGTSTINLESVQTGPATNWPVSISVTDSNSSQFATPSFEAVSANGMTGGASAAFEAGVVYSFNLTGKYAPNGNLLGYTDQIMGTWGFGYDALNRLTSSGATAGGYQGLQVAWSYDAYGNRLSESFSGTSSVAVPAGSLAQYNANNQVSYTNLLGTGLSYDAAGNVTQDNANTYLYDAEGRVCAVKNEPVAGTYIITGYRYDAEGTRVAKGNLSSPSCGSGFAAQEQYLLGPGTEQVTELTGSGGWKHSNVYGGGELLATYDLKGLHFELSDWQGTKRVQTDPLGQVEESCISLPFGDGLSCTPTVLTTSDDATEQHFTGKEHDTESGNEYFEARYLSSTLGRFLTPDWAAKPTSVPYASFGDPQTLNLYSYVENGPLNRVDAEGHANQMMGLDETIALNEGGFQGNTCGFSRCPPSDEEDVGTGGYAEHLAEANYEAQVQQVSATTGNTAAQPQFTFIQYLETPGAQQQDGQQVAQVDKDKVADYMDTHTNDTDTYHHHCAAVCHAGLAAGGLGYDKDRPSNAGENGPWLMKHGAQAVGHSDNTDLPKGLTPQKGDVAVFSGGGPKHNLRRQTMGVGYKADYVFSWAYIRRQRDSLSIPELSCACRS
jgi:RHS repeat-associated protein